MQYEAVETAVQRMVDAADDERLRAFGTETVLRLTRDNELLRSVSRWELDSNAWLALDEACQHVLTAGPAELRRQLAQIDAGVRTDGDMDSVLLIVVMSLDLWAGFLETGDRRAVYELAIRSIELVDFQAEDADPVDFLAAPDMGAEFARITRALTGGTGALSA